MFIKRTTELNLLTQQYDSPGLRLVILYGRKGIGKTSLLREFIIGKPAYYYNGVECDDRLQLNRMYDQFGLPRNEAADDMDYITLFTALAEQQEQKTVILLDEFHLIIKNGSGLLEALQQLDKLPDHVMLVLCSSSIRFVENEMVAWMGEAAARISSFVKLKEFTFVDFVNRFPKSSVGTCIYIDGILGGIPGYLEDWREDKSVKDNLIGSILDKNHRLFSEPWNYLKQELREPAVYNTLLTALAQGNTKLNELHAVTGYSRAKILVYLKALTELDIVEKLVPLGEKGRENAKKGLYRIKDHFLHFWFRFLFPHLSELELGQKETVYEQYIRPYLNAYLEDYFADVCMEYLKLMNQHRRLSVKYQWWDRWYGKNGTIHIIGKESGGETLAGRCIWEDRKAETGDFDYLITLSKEAGLTPELFYLFSKEGFTAELKELAESRKNIVLVRLEDL